MTSEGVAVAERAPEVVRADDRPMSLNWKALALAAAGLAVTFTAPPHRLDLLAIGVAATLGGLLWAPLAGPVLIGAALPFFFFSRQLVGPIDVTPPGLALILTSLAVLARRRVVQPRWPKTPYDAPLALLLVA